MKAGDCKDKGHCVGGSGNACSHTYTAHSQTHIQGLFTVVSFLQNLCPGELWDHCAVLLLSHCLVLAM